MRRSSSRSRLRLAGGRSLVVIALFSFHRGAERDPDRQPCSSPRTIRRNARPSALFGLISGQRNANYGEFAAGSLLTALPVVPRLPLPAAVSSSTT